MYCGSVGPPAGGGGVTHCGSDYVYNFGEGMRGGGRGGGRC